MSITFLNPSTITNKVKEQKEKLEPMDNGGRPQNPAFLTHGPSNSTNKQE
jgi:hypothetical protein